MIGLQIALTGAVLFVVLVFMRSAAMDKPQQSELAKSFGLLAFLALLAIPTGLIYQIWSY